MDLARHRRRVETLALATMLGLALAIDYSLFITSRFREELAKGRTTEQAVAITISTALTAANGVFDLIEGGRNA
jgi:uncharacterized membrane protein YdfJ with MMPL/SSD domain